MSSSFELLSHPDRTLAQHLRGCRQGAEMILEHKFIDEAFYPKELLKEAANLLVFYHDFGKGTDFFQLKIIDVINDEGTRAFKQENKEYIEYFMEKKHAVIKQKLHEKPELGYHAKLGAYMVQTAFHNVDPLLSIIVLMVILRHHGNLINFTAFDQQGQQKTVLEDRDKDCLLYTSPSPRD